MNSLLCITPSAQSLAGGEADPMRAAGFFLSLPGDTPPRRESAGGVSSSRPASTLTRRAYSLSLVSRGRAFAIFGVGNFVCGRRRLVADHKRPDSRCRNLKDALS